MALLRRCKEEFCVAIGYVVFLRVVSLHNYHYAAFIKITKTSSLSPCTFHVPLELFHMAGLPLLVPRFSSAFLTTNFIRFLRNRHKKGAVRHRKAPGFSWSGWRDLNARPQRPERCALAKLSHIPLTGRSIRKKFFPGKLFFHNFSICKTAGIQVVFGRVILQRHILRGARS